MNAIAYRSSWLDDELESFRGTVRRFVTEVLAPREPAWQAAHRVDVDRRIGDREKRKGLK